MSQRVTIQDIADALGVSRNTVSKAINNTGILADSTRERILNKTREMGYKQFSYLNMTTVCTPGMLGEIVLFTNGFTNDQHFSSTMLDKFQHEISRMGYSFTIHPIRSEEIDALRLPPSYSRERAAGIICVEMFDREYCSMLCELDAPVLFVDSPVFAGEELPRADYLYMDNQSGIYSLVAEMRRRGKRKIGFIGQYMHCQSFFERYMAYRNALCLSGLPCREEYGILDQRKGAEKADFAAYQDYLAERLGRMREMPELFICANDFVATDVLCAMRKIGISVPGDVWLCGFDDSAQSRVTAPPLTTIRIHSQIMGYSAAHLLVSRINEPFLNTRIVHTETNLVYRESTGD